MRLASKSVSPSALAADLARAFVLGAAAMTAFVAVAIALYVLKSKLGINLLAGPSPFHDIFVSLRQAGLV